MRISDWSSDVCSSDPPAAASRPHVRWEANRVRRWRARSTRRRTPLRRTSAPGSRRNPEREAEPTPPLAGLRAARKSGVWGKRVAVRVDLGGRPYTTKKTDTHTADKQINQTNKT